MSTPWFVALVVDEIVMVKVSTVLRPSTNFSTCGFFHVRGLPTATFVKFKYPFPD